MPREVNRAIKFTETLLICYALFVSSYLVFLIPIGASLPCRCFGASDGTGRPHPLRLQPYPPGPPLTGDRRSGRLQEQLPSVESHGPLFLSSVRASCSSGFPVCSAASPGELSVWAPRPSRGPDFASRGSCASASGVAVGSGLWALPVCCVRSTTFFLICCQRYLEWLSVQIDSDFNQATDFNWFPGIHACQNYNRLLPDFKWYLGSDSSPNELQNEFS
jgi:hypothetical protein